MRHTRRAWKFDWGSDDLEQAHWIAVAVLVFPCAYSRNGESKTRRVLHDQFRPSFGEIGISVNDLRDLVLDKIHSHMIELRITQHLIGERDLVFNRSCKATI